VPRLPVPSNFTIDNSQGTYNTLPEKLWLVAETSGESVSLPQVRSEWPRVLHPVDLSLLTLVPIALVGVFTLPLEVREQFVLDVTAPTVETAYASHYVHLNRTHLVGNLVAYALVAPVAYVLSAVSGRRRLFRTAFVTFLVAFPFALTGMQLVFPRERVLFGFSGINAAFFGLLSFVFVSYVSVHLSSSIDERDAPALLFFMLALITLLTVPSRAWMSELTLISAGIGLVYVGTVLLCAGPPDWGSLVDGWGGGRAELGIIGSGVLLLFPFLGFYQTFTGDGGIFDLYAHFLGYCLAFIVVYVSALFFE